MTRLEAKQLASIVTAAELKAMFIDARINIQDWTRVSRVNKGCTVGVAFNILSSGFEIDSPLPTNVSQLTKINMLREFGEYLPNYVKVSKKETKSINKVVHQEPRKL